MRALRLTALLLVATLGGIVLNPNSSQLEAAGSVLSMELVPEKESYPAGSLPDFTVVFRGGAEAAVLCTYMLEYRLLGSLTARSDSDEFRFEPFESAEYRPLRQDDFQSIGPGEEYRVALPVSRARGWGFVRISDRPPLVTTAHIAKGLPAGTFLFDCSASMTMAVYKGRSGVFDNTFEAKNIARDLIPAGSAPSGLCRELLDAQARVTFR